MKREPLEILGWFLSLMLGLMVTFVFCGITWRIVWGGSILWVEELSCYLLLWTIYVGAVIAVKTGSHVRIDLVVNRLPATWLKRINLFVQVLILIFLVIVSIHGSRVVFLNLNLYSDILEIRMGYIYSIVPIASIIMSVLIIRLILSGVGKARKGK